MIEKRLGTERIWKERIEGTIMVENLYNIPMKQNFSLAELEQLGLIKRSTAIKLIHNGELKAIKIMSKWFVPREALIEFLEHCAERGEHAAKRLKLA